MSRQEILDILFRSAIRSAETLNNFSVSTGGYKLTLEMVKSK
jgi:hypothetical protein